MKKLVLSLAAAAALALPSAASAQVTDNGVISVSATVQTVLRFGASTGLDFGTITPGTAATGQGSIELIRNVGTTLSFPDATALGQLVRTGGTETISPTYTCGVGATATTITTAFTNCSTATLSLAAPTGQSTSYVIFNGSIAASATNLTPGDYTGTIKILATSN
ncbi:MAG TPA: hypothetical protein VF665_18700 [Longimicrobium sp.]|jgi:hypothetical protein|uniref:hypothetical protein n=1 Tax=Longimicrobium sp. TaxID=2029185 RepID=UPI002ED77DF7